MDFHQITMKGTIYIENVSTKPADSASNASRLIYTIDTGLYYYGGPTTWVQVSGINDLTAVSTTLTNAITAHAALTTAHGSIGAIVGLTTLTAHTSASTAHGSDGAVVGANTLSAHTGATTAHGSVGDIIGLSTLYSAVSGSTNYIPKYTDVHTIGNSIISDNGTTVTVNGNLTATKVYNAVWNDIADFIELDTYTNIEYGKVYVKSGDNIRQSKKYAEIGVLGIATDTYGYGLGLKNKPGFELPIAIGGFVLAYVDREYPSGTPLTCTSNGILTKASKFTCIFHSYRIVATYYKNEKNKVYNNIVVNNRNWVKVV